MQAYLDAVLFDIGGTLVAENPPGTPTDQLQVRLLGDVVGGLADLAGVVRLGAVTDTASMTESDVRAALAGSGVDELLEVIVTSVDAGAAKPDPRPVRVAMGRLGLTDPARVLVVGDSPVDREAASAAGAHHVDITAGGGAGPAAAVAAWVRDRAGAAVRRAAAAVRPVDADARRDAERHHDTLTKPPGSLGRVEALGAQLCAIAGACPPPVPEPATVAVFAADHGVVASGVSRWPQEVTAQMVANLVSGGAAINVLARHAGADVVVVDVGVASPLPLPPGGALWPRRVRPGTADLARGPALSSVDALAALDVGVEVAEAAAAGGARALVTGDMGIGNTTSAAALVAAVTGRPAAEVTGRGAGADDAGLARKVAAVEAALRRLSPRLAAAGPDGLDRALVLLEEVGGLEIAALAGFVVGGAAAGLPVVVDGVIAGAALLVAATIDPGVLGYAVAGHRSVEPGASATLDHLGLQPVVDLDLRLGEGTGATLALPVVQAAAKVMREMATFDSAGVAGKQA